MTSGADRDREERRRLKKYRIFFRGPAYSWPKHHAKSFHQIRVLGDQKFSTYGSEHPDDDFGRAFWRSETKGIAESLVKKASRLASERQSEMKWRLEIENIVYRRFELNIECPERTCKRRWWRSEIEVMSEAPGPISASLEKRRLSRTPCQCDTKTRLKNLSTHKIGLNRVVSNRADEFITYCEETRDELNARKPDRVFGLCQTDRFSRALEKLQETVSKMVEKLVEVTKDPLIFPFLITEAKTERGDSFESSERQAAFPIWAVLKIQQELQAYTNLSLKEQGGSLVWFFSNRGECWQVYGCYTGAEEGKKEKSISYNIHNLWSGRVDSLDGALQILLIVDYIFDWARDLYKPGIHSLLESISGGFDDTMSLASDSDIHSLHHRVADWRDNLPSDLVAISASHHRGCGYELPEEESMTSNDNLPAPSRFRYERSSEIVKIKVPTRLDHNDPRFDDALQDRNIDTERTPDPTISSIRELILEDYEADCTSELTREETNWQSLLQKLKDSNEATFKIVMIGLINRHELDWKLDYMCDEPWVSRPMPTRTPQIQICQARPDLTVAFRTSTLIPDESLKNLNLLGELKGHMCPEGSKKGQIDRSFHFFSMEVDGERSRIGAIRAEFRNLNTASQALHNIYLFMKEAGEERKFFERVRVFSAVATYFSLEVRVHRPVRLLKGEHIDREYPLAFGFDEVVSLRSPYKKAQASKMIWNILVSYGVKELHPTLKDVVQRVYDLRIHEADSRASRVSATGKRATESVEESFGSQRRRLEDVSVDVERGVD